MPIKNQFAALLPDITEWRRDIHAHPEIGFETHRTAGIVAEKLRSFGCDEVVEGIGQTGVVGVIKGKNNGSGKVIALRADMDALPILEATGAEHASTNEGAMHACGHDGHTSILLGAAAYLADTRNFDGTVVLLFQPAEELGHGAKAMMDAGVMDQYGVDEVYGLHNMPGIPVGEFAIRPGPMMAATDEFFIDLKGRGGHAAKPHETVDTTVMTAHMILALQTIVSRNADPVMQAVLSVCAVDTATHAYNVIPETVRLRGTVRTHSPEVQDVIEARMGEIVSKTAEAFGGTAELRYHRYVPVTINSKEQAEFAADVARSVSGNCAEAPLIMGGEDFSYMLMERPGAFIFLGNGDTAQVHHPAYDYNDEAPPAGCSWFAELVERRMPAA